ncbi:unnamed protein product, partial [Discosporangium mesarthrocarpum]
GVDNTACEGSPEREGGHSNGNAKDDLKGAKAGIRSVGDSGGLLVGATSLFAARQGLTVLSGESVVCEVVDVLLRGARDAVIFFRGLKEAWGGEGTGGETGVSGIEEGDLLLHSAWVTCTLQALMPFFDTSPARDLGTPLAGDTSGNCARSVRLEGVSTGVQEEEEAEEDEETLPQVLMCLCDAFSVAAACCTHWSRIPSGKAPELPQEDSRGSPSTPQNVALTQTAGSAANPLWGMILSCASSLPLEILCPRDTWSRAGTGARLISAVRALAARSLDLLLGPSPTVFEQSLKAVSALPPGLEAGSLTHMSRSRLCLSGGRGDSGGRRCEVGLGGGWPVAERGSSDFKVGSRMTSSSYPWYNPNDDQTVARGKGKKEIAFPMRCFCLAAALEGFPLGERREQEEAGRGVEERGSSILGQTRTFLDPAKAILMGLRHEKEAIQRCAVAALPLFLLMAGGRTRGGAGGAATVPGKALPPQEGICLHWERDWLPALESLARTGTTGVRLELSSALPQVGAALDKTQG